MTVKQACEKIIEAIDHRIPKLVFPHYAWIGIVFRNIYPSEVHRRVRKMTIKNMAKM